MDEIDTSQQNTSNDDAESNDEHVSKNVYVENYLRRRPCIVAKNELVICVSYIELWRKKIHLSRNFTFCFWSELSFGYFSISNAWQILHAMNHLT